MIALAVDSDDRSPLVPDVPTLAELGYRENLSRVYYGLVAPAGVPKSIIDRLQSEVAADHGRPGISQEALLDRALEPVANSPEAFQAFSKRIVSSRPETSARPA